MNVDRLSAPAGLLADCLVERDGAVGESYRAHYDGDGVVPWGMASDGFHVFSTGEWGYTHGVLIAKSIGRSHLLHVWRSMTAWRWPGMCIAAAVAWYGTLACRTAGGMPVRCDYISEGSDHISL